MRRVALREVPVITCDKCGEETYVMSCLKCGKDFCYDCRKTEGVEFHHSVFFAGTGDGLYCHKCLADYDGEGWIMWKPEEAELLEAYMRIENVRGRYSKKEEDLGLEADKADRMLKRLLDNRKQL